MKRAFSESEISSFISKVIGQNSKFNQQKISESINLVQISSALEELIPAALFDHVYPYKYTEGRLLIHVDHGIYAQQLQLHSKEIISRLQTMINPGIQKMEIRVGNVYRKNHKTDDIMSRNRKMVNHGDNTGHPNANLIDQLISELNKGDA